MLQTIRANRRSTQVGQLRADHAFERIQTVWPPPIRIRLEHTQGVGRGVAEMANLLAQLSIQAMHGDCQQLAESSGVRCLAAKAVAEVAVRGE